MRATSGQFVRQLRHGDVVFLRHPPKNEVPVRLQLGVPASAHRLRRETTPRPKGLHQLHHKRHRHPKMGRRLVAGMTRLDKANNAFAKVT